MSNTHPRPWHRGSLYGPGPRRPLDREQRARVRYLLTAYRRARRITPLAALVGEALVRHLSSDGRCDPSHATLAVFVGCSARTVRRATDALRRLGVLVWQRRIVRSGWRVEQTSNAYVLVPADTVVVPISRVVRCDGQTSRPTSTLSSVLSVPPTEAELEAARAAMAAMAQQPHLGHVAEAQAALARRRVAIEGRLLERGRG